MTPYLKKMCLLAGAGVMLAQPVLAQDTTPTQAEALKADAQAEAAQPEMRPYSQDELQAAYERGRADASREYSAAPPPPPDQPEPVGYCYQRKASARTTGTIVGAILGGVIGSNMSDRWNRGSNTIGGAMLGSMLGSAVGDDSVSCYRDAYYAYDDGYYAPPAPPRGFVTVFFSSTPSYGRYHHYRGRHNWRHDRW